MKRLPKLFASMDAFLQQVVDQRRLLPREEEARDVLDTLLSLRYTDEEGQKQPLKDWAGKFNIELVMLAGVDTISTVVEWVLAELLRHLYCIVKMQEEMDNVVGKHRQVEQGDQPNLPYLRAVVIEGMLLNPIGPLLTPRRCTKDTVVDGYHIAAETVVLIYVNAMQRDPAAWPDANQFRPERFLNSCRSVTVRVMEWIRVQAGRHPRARFQVHAVRIRETNMPWPQSGHRHGGARHRQAGSQLQLVAARCFEAQICAWAVLENRVAWSSCSTLSRL